MRLHPRILLEAHARALACALIVLAFSSCASLERIALQLLPSLVDALSAELYVLLELYMEEAALETLAPVSLVDTEELQMSRASRISRLLNEIGPTFSDVETARIRACIHQHAPPPS